MATPSDFSEPPLTEAERCCAELAARRDGVTAASDRKARGIVHTPPELCRVLVREADRRLRESFGLTHGLASPEVLLVDPACGTGAFLAAAHALCERGRAPGRVVGIDVDGDALRFASDALAPLSRDAWPLELVQGDALDSLELFQGSRIAVVIGNPPWSGRSESKTDLLQSLLVDFRRDPETGQPLHERRIGVLSDAYVRFMRYALEALRLAENGGVFSLITNGSFLDGPVHRGMRAFLASECTTIDVIDLGGSALIAKSRTDRDENLFGVRPAVAMTFATRVVPAVPCEATIRVASVRGSREEKLHRLQGHAEFQAVSTGATWRSREPGSEQHWPESYRSIEELFPFHREGVQTNRDALVTDVDRERLVARLQSLSLGLRLPAFDGIAREHFDVQRAARALREAFAADASGESFVRPLAYRPAETRFFVTLPEVCHRPRRELIAACEHSEFSLLSVRKDRGERAWNHFAVSKHVPDSCFLSARSSCRTRAFPTHTEKGANLSPLAWDWFEGDVVLAMDYVLGVLADPEYRTRFSSLLAGDYPRVPPPNGRSSDIIALGHRLRLGFLDLEACPALPDTAPSVDIGHWRVSVPAGLFDSLPTQNK